MYTQIYLSSESNWFFLITHFNIFFYSSFAVTPIGNFRLTQSLCERMNKWSCVFIIRETSKVFSFQFVCFLFLLSVISFYNLLCWAHHFNDSEHVAFWGQKPLIVASIQNMSGVHKNLFALFSCSIAAPAHDFCCIITTLYAAA